MIRVKEGPAAGIIYPQRLFKIICCINCGRFLHGIGLKRLKNVTLAVKLHSECKEVATKDPVAAICGVCSPLPRSMVSLVPG